MTSDLEKKIEKIFNDDICPTTHTTSIPRGKVIRRILTLFKEREASWREEMAKKVEELRPSNEKGYTVSFHNARTMAAALLRSTKDEPPTEI